MKNTFYSVLIWVTGAALISSCNSSSDLTSSSFIQKRKYTKGFHVDFGAKKHDKPAVAASIERAAPAREVAPVDASKPGSQGSLLTASASDAIDETSAASAVNKRSFEPESTEMPADMAASDATAVQFKADIDRREMRKSIRSHRKAARNAAAAGASASGESLLLYVIIAIFIPPLAVGLLYGISTEFWISLLLTILFFIPGMIYSIIKVLAA